MSNEILKRKDRSEYSANSIHTLSGNILDLDNPSKEDMRLDDIVTGISRECRFSNQTLFPYSVAQHSVLVHDLVLEATGDFNLSYAALLHDAHEAYVRDLASPMKTTCNRYCEVEDGVQEEVLRFFDCKMNIMTKTVVKTYDRLALEIELAHFWPDRYDLPEGYEDVELEVLSESDARLGFIQTLFEYREDLVDGE